MHHSFIFRHSFLFFFLMDIENDKLEKKNIGLFSRCKETLLMDSMMAANMMVKY